MELIRSGREEMNFLKQANVHRCKCKQTTHTLTKAKMKQEISVVQFRLEPDSL